MLLFIRAWKANNKHWKVKWNMLQLMSIDRVKYLLLPFHRLSKMFSLLILRCFSIGFSDSNKHSLHSSCVLVVQDQSSISYWIKIGIFCLWKSKNIAFIMRCFTYDFGEACFSDTILIRSQSIKRCPLQRVHEAELKRNLIYG